MVAIISNLFMNISLQKKSNLALKEITEIKNFKNMN
tara:strand:- start:462 stop:569 length:108 start_codon:yes stop_codon:yes gene_type:complete